MPLAILSYVSLQCVKVDCNSKVQLHVKEFAGLLMTSLCKGKLSNFGVLSRSNVMCSIVHLIPLLKMRRVIQLFNCTQTPFSVESRISQASNAMLKNSHERFSEV